jgi:hypothetical protein
MEMSLLRCRLSILAGLALAVAACGDPDPETTVVARAAGHELTVERQARLLAEVPRLWDERTAASNLAGLWVDYVLLATAAAEDSTFAHLELGAVVDQLEEQAVQAALRDAVAREAGGLPSEELRRRYDREARDSEIRVRQILISAPVGSTQARRDSAQRTIQRLRDRIVEGGERFEEVAREHNQDPRTMARDGDLGFFGRGDMVAPFEQVVYALEPGEIGGPVETAYGYHLVRLEERRTPTREAFARRLEREHETQLAREFAVGLEQQARPRLRQGAAASIERLVGFGPASDGEMAADTLVLFDGGAVTLMDIWNHLRRQPPEARDRLVGADAAALTERLIRPLVLQRLLTAEAHRRGLRWTEQDRQRREADVRQGLKEGARRLGLLDIRRDGDDAGAETLTAAVERALLETIREDQGVIRVGPASFALRDHYPVEIRQDRTDLVVRRLEALRQDG